MSDQEQEVYICVEFRGNAAAKL